MVGYQRRLLEKDGGITSFTIIDTKKLLVTNVIIQSIPNDSRAFVMIKLNPLINYRGGAFAFNC